MDMTDLEALKARHPLLEAARELGLEVLHNRFRCPRSGRHAHGDRTPSVTLWPERGFFKCWVCPDVKGDVIDLVRIVKDVGFSEAVASLEKGAVHASGAGAPKHHSPRPVSQTQVELFQEPGTTTHEPPPGPRSEKPAEAARRIERIQAFLDLCGPVRGKAAAWLKGRRIFRKTWEGQRLRVVENYRGVSDGLLSRFSMAELRESGLFNAEGHLRFYRHPLILPYFDVEAPVYLQARALEPEVQPKELSLAGTIPCPYNVRVLDGNPGPVYLCEGAVDALTLLDAGFPAAGVPGAAQFKPAWAPRFWNKSVYVAFDPDAAGEAGAARVIALLREAGIEAHRVQLPAGKDINDWLRGGGLGTPL